MDETQLPGYCAEDEIDLLEIARVLWKGKRVILGLTVIMALVAWGVSLRMPRRYQASAVLMIQQPPFRLNVAGVGYVNVRVPELKMLTELAESPFILKTVTADSEVVGSLQGDVDIAWQALAESVKVSQIGKNGLQLTVQHADPQLAAFLANRWAEEVARRINLEYGYADVLNDLASKMQKAQQNYQKAQEEYSQVLAESQKKVLLEAQLAQVKGNLSCVLAREGNIQRLLKDLQILSERLRDMNGDLPIGAEDALTLVDIQQRMSATGSCAVEMTATWVQREEVSEKESDDLIVLSAQPVMSLPVESVWRTSGLETLTANQALEVIAAMQSVLRKRAEDLSEQRSSVEQQIPQLQQTLEDLRIQLREAEGQRDTAWETYQSLARLQTWQTVLTGEGCCDVAVIVTQAVPPARPVAPRVALNTVLAAVLGAMLGVMWVLVAAWWQGQNQGGARDEPANTN